MPRIFIALLVRCKNSTRAIFVPSYTEKVATIFIIILLRLRKIVADKFDKS